MRMKNPYPKDENVTKAIDAFQGFFTELSESRDVDRARQIIHSLCNYERTLPRRMQNITGCLVHNLKRWIEMEVQEYPDRHNRRKHRMSDHAFVRILELVYGFDIDELKDKAISEIEASGKFKFIFGGDKKKIVTVIPEHWLKE